MSGIMQLPIGSLVSAASTALATRSDDSRSRRRAAGDHLYRSLVVLKKLMARKDVGQELEVWVGAIGSVYDSFDENRFTLPPQWSHLKRSVRVATGEATGLAFIDLSTLDPTETVKFNGNWLEFAGDYLEYAAGVVGRWREHYSGRRADSEKILEFDVWLARTGRYIPGLGVWPEHTARQKKFRR